MSETRLDIWKLFLSALLHQPWFGYGWDQSLLAQASLLTEVPTTLVSLGAIYAQAHNLFLDFLVWMGIPLGLGVVSAILYWITHRTRFIKTDSEAIIMMLVFAVGLHAMLELPLHHAYMLMPLGLIVGIVESRMGTPTLFITSTTSTLAIWFFVCTMYIFVVRDYFRVEESYNELRLEKSRVLSKFERGPPDVVLLTQLRDLIVFSRYQPKLPITTENITWIKNMALTYPTPQNLIKLATALALTGKAPEAVAWLGRICVLSTKEQCSDAKDSWKHNQLLFPELEIVSWPDKIVN